jgi:DNA-binding CsgD family transcriptional regulator
MRGTRMNHSNLLVLIERVYAAAEEAALWQEALRAIADALAASAACLVAHDLVGSGAVVISARMDPEGLQLYNEYYHRVDAWGIAAGERNLAVPGRVLPDQAIVPRASLEATEYYPFVHRYGISRLLHTTLEKDATGVAGLGFYRTDLDPEFGRRETEFLQALAPHLRRALRVQASLARHAEERQIALDTLDTLALGVLLVSEEGVVVHANRAAANILAARDGLRVDRRRLTARAPAATAALRSLLAECGRTTRGEGPEDGGVLRLPRASGPRDLQVLVCPVRQRSPLGLPDPRVGAMVLVPNPDDDPPPSPLVLQALYGLTPAEGQIAARLALGESIEEIADSCGYTRQTVQWYNKQILGKTGCRDRAALVRTLSRGLAAMAAGGGHA